MRFVTYISALPKKCQTAAENMSNLIQEILYNFYRERLRINILYKLQKER